MGWARRDIKDTEHSSGAVPVLKHAQQPRLTRMGALLLKSALKQRTLGFKRRACLPCLKKRGGGEGYNARHPCV